MTIQTINNQNIFLRERPAGVVLATIPPLTSVNLLGGWHNTETSGGPTPVWWWYAEYAGLRGYVSETVIQPNFCPRTSIPPLPDPVPSAGSQCYVRLNGTSASVYNYLGSVVYTITNPNQQIRVYGRSSDIASERYLISEPGAEQRWVNRAMFQPVSGYGYGCTQKVLGRFQSIEHTSERWRRIAYYANTFNAPVNFGTNTYTAFRNSQPFGSHDGVDLVYAPPNGFGSLQEFPVYAQQNGIIVDAGPSGITGRFIMDGFTSDPTAILGGPRDGMEYLNGSLYFAATWLFDGNPFNDTAEEPTSGYRYEQPPFGVNVEETNLLIQNGGRFRLGDAPCYWAQLPNPQNPSSNFPSLPGCVSGPDRQVIIWYAENATQGHPDLQTIYYHTDVIQSPHYTAWRNICSRRNRQETWSRTVGLESTYQICRVNASTYLGQVRWLGWSSGSHLHYEVFTYDSSAGVFNSAGRFDPLTAFATFR